MEWPPTQLCLSKHIVSSKKAKAVKMSGAVGHMMAYLSKMFSNQMAPKSLTPRRLLHDKRTLHSHFNSLNKKLMIIILSMVTVCFFFKDHAKVVCFLRASMSRRCLDDAHFSAFLLLLSSLDRIYFHFLRWLKDINMHGRSICKSWKSVEDLCIYIALDW